MALIPPLDPSSLDLGFKTYLDGDAGIAALQVPAPDPAAGLGPPTVTPHVSKTEVDPHTVEVAVKCVEASPEARGFYEPVVSVWVITPATVDHVTEAHHRAVVRAIAEAFPGRPAPASADLPAWEVKEAALSAACLAASGYFVEGWWCEQGAIQKNGDRWEQQFAIKVGANHSSLAPPASSSSSGP